MKKFTNNILVSYDEIDHQNHVNNVVYLQWINDISIKHWNAVSNDEINSNYTWVAVRHEIDYLKPAFLDEKITVTTWIESLAGVKSIRRVEIYRDNELLAKSKTTWVLLDANTQKITRIPESINSLFNSMKAN